MKRQEFINQVIDNNYKTIDDIIYSLNVRPTDTVKDFKKETYDNNVHAIIGTVTFLFEDGNVDVRGVLEIYKKDYWENYDIAESCTIE